MRDHELELEMESEFEFESELESELEMEGEAESELEHEFESEAAFHEGEHELNPVRRVYLDAMLEMEHFAAMAAESESEQEAEQFFPLLLPLAAKALPFVAKAGAKFLPKIVGKFAPRTGRFLGRHRGAINDGIKTLGRYFIRRGRRRLNRTLPTIVRRTVGQIQNQTARGRSPSPHQARRMLFTQARRVLNNPAVLNRAMQTSRAADRLYHRRLQGVSGGPGGVPAMGRKRWRGRRRGCGCGCGCCRCC